MYKVSSDYIGPVMLFLSTGGYSCQNRNILKPKLGQYGGYTYHASNILWLPNSDCYRAEVITRYI